MIREQGQVRAGSVGGMRSAAAVVGAVAAADAVVAAERLGQLGRTVLQRWLEIGFDGAVVVVVRWVGGCEGRGGGGVEQRGVGHTGWVVVQDT